MVTAGERALFDEAIARISAVVEAHCDEPGWREIVERTSGNRGSTTFVVTVDEPGAAASESYLIRVCRGRFEVVAPVAREVATDWRVSRDELRRLCDTRARPAEWTALPLAWLTRRLGIEPEPERA